MKGCPGSGRRRLRFGKLATVRVLDGLNAARFADLPGERAKWESARNVFGPITRGGEGATHASPEQAIA